MLKIKCIVVLAVLFALMGTAQAEDEYLFGEWGGLRPALEKEGISYEVVLTHDLVRNFSGGLDKDGTLLGNFDFTLELDTATAGWWQNGTLFFYVLGNYNSGGLLTEIVGDIQATSNIETDNALRLYEAWYEHRFLSDRLSLLVGMHDYNSEFNALEYAGLFLNSSFGIEPDISQVGPSIFPIAALATRLRLQPSENTYVLAAIYDGVPGDPDKPSRTRIKLDDGDGLFAALEVGLVQGEAAQADYHKLGLGVWRHTTELATYSGEQIDSNIGIYLIAETRLYTESHEEQGLGCFIQFGLADEDKNQIGRYWGAGVHYTGLLPGRDSDVMGLAVASARNANNFLRFNQTEGVELDHTETAIEWSYRAQVQPWLVLQPDVQYVINPGMDPLVDDALLAGVRVEVSF